MSGAIYERELAQLKLDLDAAHAFADIDKQRLTAAYTERDNLREEIGKLQAENNDLRKALEHYADPVNWACYGKMADVVWDGDNSGPTTAKNALADVKK